MHALEADINSHATNGLTPLMVAVVYDNVEAASWMLTNGAELSSQTTLERESCLHLAARYGRDHVFNLLYRQCQPADLLARDHSGRTVLHTAVAADSGYIIKVSNENY